MTTVQDFITNLNGTPANGRLVINSPPMTVGGVAVAASQIFADIVEGAVTVDVYSNLNAQPTGVYYTVFYELDQGPVYEENWIVPNLPTVNIGQIRAAFPLTPSIMINAQQLTSAGALPGQFLGWSGANWTPMYVTSFNYYPNFIGLNVTGAAAPDLAVTGSPAALGSNFTLNVPDAGITSRGVVNTVAQTFGGNKTFANNVAITGSLTGANAVFTDVTVTGQLLATGTSNLLIDPTTAKGDLITRAASTGSVSKFAAGPNGSILTADATQPLGLRWGPPALGDPTTTLGDLIVRGSAGPVRLGVASTNGYVLTADSNQPYGLAWEAAAGGVPVTRMINTGLGLQGGGSLANDLTLSVRPNTTNQQVGVLANSITPPTYLHKAINFIAGANVTVVIGEDTTNDWSDVTIASTGGPVGPTGVTSVFGRNNDDGNGGVLAHAGDYASFYPSLTGSYADPAWLSISWGKITGKPATFPPSPHTHDASDIVTGIIATARLGTGTANNAVYLRGDSTWATPPGAGQTPWTSNIDGAGFQLRNAGWIGIGTSTIPIQSPIAGRAYLTIKGSTDAGVMEVATGSADADQTLIGRIAYTDPANNQADKRSAFIDAYRSGSAVNDRGSLLAFWTRPDGGSTPSERMVLSNQGYLGVGTLTPAHMVDVAGDVNVTGQFLVNGSPLVSGYWTAGSGGVIYYNGGNVGIGTAAPGVSLDVVGNARIQGGANPTTGAGLEFAYTSGVAYIQPYDRSAASYRPLLITAASVSIGASPTTGNVVLQSAGGKVGIGTATPTALLQVGPGNAYSTTNQAILPGVVIFNGYSSAFPWCFMEATDSSGVNSVGFRWRVTNAGTMADCGIIDVNGYWGIGFANSPVRTLQVGSVPAGGGVAVTGTAPNIQLSNANTDPNTNTMAGTLALSTANGNYAGNAGDLGLFTQGSARGHVYIGANYSGGGGVRGVYLQPWGGPVGIGLSVAAGFISANTMLDVRGGRAYFTGSSEPYEIGLAYGSGGAWMYIGTNPSNQFQVSNNGGTPMMTVDQSGNSGVAGSFVCATAVTINSGAQQGAININSAQSDPGIQINNQATGGRAWQLLSSGGSTGIGAGNFTIYDGTGGGSVIVCSPSHNVGIANISPAYRLDVAGDCNITGTYRINGAPLATGGGPTTWGVYSSATRPINVTQTNGTGKPLYVAVCVAVGAQTVVSAVVAGNVVADFGFSTGGGNCTLFFIVLPGQSYYVNTGTWQSWVEWN